jgi:protoporphyrinogen oxidase
VLERLRYLGGRFTTVDQDGSAITTGALHMAPHGGGGPLARAVRDLGLSFDIVPRDLLASFYVRAQHVMWNKRWDVMRLFGARGRLDMLKITTWLSAPCASSESQPFGEWLAAQTGDVAIHQFFESFVQFAVCVTANQIRSVKCAPGLRSGEPGADARPGHGRRRLQAARTHDG